MTTYTKPHSGEKSTEHVITILAETDEGREVLRSLLIWKFGMLGQLSVEHHKEQFGKQSYCLTTHRRFWVWEFESYRILVNNERGVDIEIDIVSDELRFEAAKTAVMDYMSRWREGMKPYTRDQLNKLLAFKKPQLLAIIHAGSAGKKWHCGVGGDQDVAKQIGVRTRDLESLVSACWNAIAQQSCEDKDKEGPDAYRRITANLLDEMDQETQTKVMDWAQTVEWKDEWTRKDDEELWG